MKWLFRLPRYQVYFLQLENYELGRFWKLIPKTYASQVPMRHRIVWTPKLLAVASIAFLIEVFLAASLGLFLASSLFAALVIAFLVFIVLLLSHFVFLSIAVLLVSPADFLAKKRIIYEARGKLNGYRDLTIIAIAGSYGKTTMKEALTAVLSEKYKTLATPGNINTPIGISRAILDDLRPDTEVFIVEMGEHYPGDITFLTELTPPDVVILTGIGAAHQERFGTPEALAAGIFEAVSGMKKGGLAVLNADSEPIRENYKRYTEGREFAFYSSRNDPLARFVSETSGFRDDGSGFSFTLSEKEVPIGNLDTPLLGEYAIGIAEACFIVGRRMGVSENAIRAGFGKLRPVPHRLQIVPSGNGVLVIDDSYNGNPEGVRYAIEVLGRFKDRRKVYITPGLVEGGEKTEEIHREIGKLLAGTADIVVLIRNSVTPFIADELQKGGFPEERIRWFASGPEAHAAVPDIVKAGDVVVFQNDWPDNYT